MREVNNECPVCGKETLDQFMVTDECWAEAGFTFYQNVHLHCLAETLDRPLVLADFPDSPVNIDMPQILEFGARLPQEIGNRLDRLRGIERNVGDNDMPKVTSTIGLSLSGAQSETYKDAITLLLKRDCMGLVGPLDTLHLVYNISEELSETNSIVANLTAVLAVCADDEVPVEFDMFALEMFSEDMTGMARQITKLIEVLKGRRDA